MPYCLIPQSNSMDHEHSAEDWADQLFVFGADYHEKDEWPDSARWRCYFKYFDLMNNRNDLGRETWLRWESTALPIFVRQFPGARPNPFWHYSKQIVPPYDTVTNEQGKIVLVDGMTQAKYLDRYKLFLRGERRRIPTAALIDKPTIVEVTTSGESNAN